MILPARDDAFKIVIYIHVKRNFQSVIDCDCEYEAYGMEGQCAVYSM